MLILSSISEHWAHNHDPPPDIEFTNRTSFFTTTLNRQARDKDHTKCASTVQASSSSHACVVFHLCLTSTITSRGYFFGKQKWAKWAGTFCCELLDQISRVQRNVGDTSNHGISVKKTFSETLRGSLLVVCGRKESEEERWEVAQVLVCGS